MITRFAALTGRLVVALAILFTIAACGGGGGGDGGSFIPESENDGPVYQIQLNITDADGNRTDTVTATAPVTLNVLVTRKANGGSDPVAGAVVTAVVDIGSILPEDGTALTDSSGFAYLQIVAGDALGAGTVNVSVANPTDGAEPFTAKISFRVGQAGLRLGHFEDSSFVDGQIGIDSAELAVGGSAVLRMAVVDENGDLATTTELIKLKSGCVLSGLAILPAEVETVNGQATATYTANGCGGEDEITANLDSNGALAVGTLTLAEPQADVIQFLGASPTAIALLGTGSADRPEKSTVAFSVISGTGTEEDPGTPLPGVAVKFSLSTDVGGATLQNTSGTTDSEGQVTTILQAGSVSTTVRVRATIELEDGTTVFTTSDPIAITTGLPDQNSISLSSETYLVAGAADFDNRPACLTVRMADKFNNPALDGTQALFTTEYGAIDDFCLTGTQNGKLYEEHCGDGTPPGPGECHVAWISQNPRGPSYNEDLVKTIAFSNSYRCPSHNGEGGPCPDDLGGIRGLRSTVLVTAVGEEDFTDSNGNGLYDQGESFVNLPEAFLDNNEDRVYTPTVGPECPNPPTSTENCEAAGAEETFTDYNGDFKYSLNDNPAVYNGSLCPVEGEEAGWCSRDLVNVRDDIVLVMGSSEAAEFGIVMLNARTERLVSKVVEGDKFVVYISDLYNNAPPSDVPVSVETQGDCMLLSPSESDDLSAPDNNSRGAYGITVIVEGEGEGGALIVTVGASSKTFFCDTFVPDELVDGPEA
jgi:hypothetical protein